MKRTKDEILASIRAKIGDSTEDDDLKLLEDISDTFDDLSQQVANAGDWKTKYEENDKAWKQKYRDRFFNKEADEEIERHNEEQEHDDEPPKKLTFDALFTTESETK